MYKKSHIHFVGIGGIGMSGIAEVLLNLGYPVSGSDLKRSATTTRLKKRGAKIFVGHKEKNIEGADVVVYSSAVKKAENVEVNAALKKGIPVVRRAEMLAELMRLKKYGIAVAGTHGKTTTTSLLSAILHHGGLDPTVVIGGKVNSLRSNARLGKGDFMLVEADESDGSFLHLLPTIAAVTNIDPDHLENFKNFEHYQENFFNFCEKVPFHGLVVLCGEHPKTVGLSKKLDKRISLYGFSKNHDWNAQNLKFVHSKSSFDLYHKNNYEDKIELNLPGKHNVLNSLAAIAIAKELGVGLSKIKKALKNFKGVGRRMEILFKDDNIVTLDDYAHHPQEITATLSAVRTAYTGRLVVLFQPHRFSRLKNLYEEFQNCFQNVDQLFLTEVYAAGEKPIKGFHGKRLAKDLSKRLDVQFLNGTHDAANEIYESLKPGDVFLTMGAGDITKVARTVAKRLKCASKNYPSAALPSKSRSSRTIIGTLL